MTHGVEAQMVKTVVSVIMAAHNAERTIASAMASVLAQTFQDLELIVVDDASSDDTVAVVEACADPRIRLTRHTANRGPAAARNTGLDIAKGTWATVLDADDAWHPERLEYLMSAAARHPDAILGDDVYFSLPDRSGNLVPWKSSFESGGLVLNGEISACDLYTLITHNVDIKPLFPLEPVRTRHLRMWEEAFGAEWLEFIAQLVGAGLNLYVTRRPLYYYRLSRDNLTARYDELLREILVCERLLQMAWLDERTKAAVRVRRQRLQWRRPWTALRNHHWARAVADLMRYPGSVGYALARLPAIVSRARYARELKKVGGVGR
jgi:succinoglycan biosynthesis protein ExoO